MIRANLKVDGVRRMLANFRAAVPGTTRVVLVKLGAALLLKILLKNPVRFGRSRAGWTISGELLDVTVPPGPEDMTEAEKGAAKLQQVGGTWRLTLTNGVAYTFELERGYSTQAPYGMVRVSLRELEAAYGGRALPAAIQSVYAEVIQAGIGGVRAGSEIRAGAIAEALGLTPGFNVGYKPRRRSRG